MPPRALPPLAAGQAPPADVLSRLSVPDVLARYTPAERSRLVPGEGRQILDADLQREQAALQASGRTPVE